MQSPNNFLPSNMDIPATDKECTLCHAEDRQIYYRLPCGHGSSDSPSPMHAYCLLSYFTHLLRQNNIQLICPADRALIGADAAAVLLANVETVNQDPNTRNWIMPEGRPLGELDALLLSIKTYLGIGGGGVVGGGQQGEGHEGDDHGEGEGHEGEGHEG